MTSLMAEAALRVAGEFHKVVDERIIEFCEASERGFERKPRTQKYSICLFQSLNLARFEARASQPHKVQSPRASGVAVRYNEWQTILHYLRVAAYHGETPYAAELMHDHAARYESLVFDCDRARKGHIVCDYHAVADLAIVRDMRVSHDEAIRAYARHRPGLGSAMHGHAFAYAISRAYSKVAFAIAVAHVLRFAAEHGPFVNDVVRSQCSESLDDRMSANFSAIAYIGVRLDQCIRAYMDSGTEPRAAAYYRGRMYGHKRSESL